MNLPSADFVLDLIVIAIVLVLSVSFVSAIKWMADNL